MFASWSLGDGNNFTLICSVGTALGAGVCCSIPHQQLPAKTQVQISPLPPAYAEKHWIEFVRGHLRGCLKSEEEVATLLDALVPRRGEGDRTENANPNPEAGPTGLDGPREEQAH